MNDTPTTLDAMHTQVWQRLMRGTKDKKAPENQPVLATAGLSGGAEVRTVVLRAASQAEARIEVHTDLLTDKVAELRADPCASLHVWNAKARLQTRLRLRVEILSGDQVAEVWANVPEGSRAAYGPDPAPATPIDTADGFARVPAADRFAILRGHVEEIDVVHLGQDQHRRALFRASDGFVGIWLVP